MNQELLPEKKLLEDVYLKAKNLDGATSDSGVFKDVSTDLINTHKINLSYKTMLGYYESVILEKKKYKSIKKSSLDALSKYLGYQDYVHYKEKNGFFSEQSSNNDISVRIGNGIDAFTESINSIIIKITHAPTFKFSEMLNKNNAMGFGVFGLFLTVGSFAHFNGYLQKKDHMYWNGVEYRLTFKTDLNPKHTVIPLDTVKFKYFRKITRPDTLDIVNGLNNVWYSKYQNKVEFFTMDGVNPDNHKALKPVTERIIQIHAN